MSQLSKFEDCQVKIYERELFQSFQHIYKESLSHKKEISYDNCKDKCLHQAGIDYYQPESLEIFKTWYENIHNLNYIKFFLEDDNVNEVIISTDGNLQLVGINKENHQINLSVEDISLSFEVLASKQEQEWNYSNPFLSMHTKLYNIPLRATLIHFSASAKKESKLFLRKHKEKPLTLAAFGVSTSLNLTLEQLILEKRNILITGATGSGKTSFLNSLLNLVPCTDHIMAIEDTYEISCSSPNFTSLLSDHKPQKTMKDYCAYAMRMSPDRLVIGELRSHEIVSFLLSLNTGHKGVMATTHANSAKEGLERLALLYSLYSESSELKYPIILELLSRNIDYVIHMKDKRVNELIKIYGSEGNNIQYETFFSNQKEFYEEKL